MNRGLWVILLAGLVGFLLVGGVWMDYNLFTDGLNPFLGMVLFLLLICLLIVVAVAVKRGKLAFTTEEWFWVACLGWALGAVSTIFSGPLSTFDLQLHDTYFVIAYIHLFASLAVVFGAFGLFYHYNRWMGRVLGLIHFWMTFWGSLLFIWPPRLGDGMPRRYMDYSNWVSFNQFGTYEMVVVGMLGIGLLAQLVFLVNVVYSMVGGRKSVD